VQPPETLRIRDILPASSQCFAKRLAEVRDCTEILLGVVHGPINSDVAELHIFQGRVWDWLRKRLKEAQ
jgi:hypothetical protein